MRQFSTGGVSFEPSMIFQIVVLICGKCIRTECGMRRRIWVKDVDADIFVVGT